MGERIIFARRITIARFEGDADIKIAKAQTSVDRLAFKEAKQLALNSLFDLFVCKYNMPKPIYASNLNIICSMIENITSTEMTSIFAKLVGAGLTQSNANNSLKNRLMDPSIMGERFLTPFQATYFASQFVRAIYLQGNPSKKIR